MTTSDSTLAASTTTPGSLSAGGADPVTRNSAALLVNSCATAVLGMLFWLAAAHEYSTSALGASAALISLMLLLANIAELNLTSVLIRFLPTAGARRRTLLLRSYATAAVLGFIVGVVAIPLARSHISLLSHVASHGPAGWLAFGFAVSAWCVFALQDAAAIALRGATWVPLENAAFGIAKLVVLMLLASVSERYGLLIAWIVPMVVILVPMNVLIFRVLIPGESERTTRTETVARRQLGRFMGFEYVSSLLATATVTLVPIVIAASTTNANAGHFYLVWLVATSIATALNAVGYVVTGEGSRTPERLGAVMSKLARRGAMFGVPLLIVGELAAQRLLEVVGASYATDGTGLLRWILVTSIFQAIIVGWMSAQRVIQHTGRVLMMQALLTLGVVGSACLIVAAGGSLTLVGAAYFATHALCAAIVSPSLVTITRVTPEPLRAVAA